MTFQALKLSENRKTYKAFMPFYVLFLRIIPSSVGDPVEGPGRPDPSSPLFLDQIESRGAESFFLRAAPLISGSGYPPPLSSPPPTHLFELLKIWIGHWSYKGDSALASVFLSIYNVNSMNQTKGLFFTRPATINVY